MKTLLLGLFCALALVAEVPAHYVFTRSAASLRNMGLPSAEVTGKDTIQVLVLVPDTATGVVVRLAIGEKQLEGYATRPRVGWALVVFQVDLATAGRIGSLEIELQKADPVAKVETPVVIPL